MLSWLIFFPLITAGICLLIPARAKGLIKFVSVVGSIVAFVIASMIAWDYMEAEENPAAATGDAQSARVVLETRVGNILSGVPDDRFDEINGLLPPPGAAAGTFLPLTEQQIADLGGPDSSLVDAWGRATALRLAANVEQAKHLRFVEHFAWLEPFRINYFLAADGLSLPLVWLTALLGVLCLVYSCTIDKGTKAYFILFLILETGLLGVFLALDFFLFYVFWEIVLLPMYFLIGIWGGPNRIYAAIKFFIYTLVGSVIMLLCMLVLYFWQEPNTFNMLALMELGPGIALDVQVLLFLGLFIGFAIKVPIFPFHTWLPDAHVEAPTAVSVILAGILLKMGGYGFFRVAYPMLPDAATSSGIVFMVASLGAINIVYGAFCALAQKDFKKLVAYSSVSHMGFMMLGLAALTYTSINGAVLQMFTHGITSAMMFLIVGVLYDRAHHRNLDDFGGIGLQMPWYTGIAIVGFFASLGLPGLCGFISEALVFIGVWDTNNSLITAIGARWLVFVSLLGIVLGAAYILWTIQRVYLGTVKDKYKNFRDVSFRELVSLVPLAILCVIIGVFPQQTILKHIQPSLEAMTNMVRRSLE